MSYIICIECYGNELHLRWVINGRRCTPGVVVAIVCLISQCIQAVLTMSRRMTYASAETIFCISDFNYNM